MTPRRCSHSEGLLRVVERRGWKCMTCEQLFAEMPEYKPASEYHEDLGTVLWWHLPVDEPPHVDGLIEDDNLRTYYTHWSPLVMPATNGKELL